MAKLRQVSAFGPATYRGIPFSKDKLREYIDGTNKAIAAGISIPLLSRHAPINADDEATKQFADTEGRGWLTKLFQDDNGALGWEADNVPEEFVKEVNEGRVKLTSPEFRNNYKSELEGLYEGPIVRHMAFTPLPGNPLQGAIETIALQELGVFQFSEVDKDEEKPEELVVGEVEEAEEVSQHVEMSISDLLSHHGWDKSEGGGYTHAKHKGHVIIPKDDKRWTHSHANPKKKAKDGYGSNELATYLTHFSSQHAEKNADGFGTPENDLPDPNQTQVNPDAPPVANDKTKVQAAIAGMARKNIILPSDWNPLTDPIKALELLIGCTNSSLAAEDAVKAEAEPDPESPPPQEVSMPFAEGFGGHKVFAHNLAKKHGYKLKHGGATTEGRNIYGHDEGHSFDVYPDGSWSHYGKDSKSEPVTGKNIKGLQEHLDRHHGSQHSEQFSEEELAALPPKARQVIEAGQKALAEERAAKEKAEKDKQFAEEQERTTRNNAAKEKAIANIKSLKLPPVLTNKLLAGYTDTIQFSEGNEQPTFTAEQVAVMVRGAIPKAMQFEVEDVVEADKPKTKDFFAEGDIPKGHVSAERAEEIVAESRLGNTRKNWKHDSISKQVAEENARNPNQVIRT